MSRAADRPGGLRGQLARFFAVHHRDTPALLDRVGAQIESAIRSELATHPALSVLTQRRFGGIGAIEAANPEDHGYLAPMGDMLCEACRANSDVLLRPLGPVLYALPPACTSPDEAATIGRAIVKTYAMAWQRATSSPSSPTHA